MTHHTAISIDQSDIETKIHRAHIYFRVTNIFATFRIELWLGSILTLEAGDVSGLF